MDRLANSYNFGTLAVGDAGVDHVLNRCKVLSLDVFDTLLVRRCLRPTDVFDWMEHRLDLPGFAQARVSAEAAARRRHKNRGSEVSLEEIYAELKKEFRLPESTLAFELEAERHFLFPNPSIVALVQRARHLGLRVIAVSDIYLSSSQVTDLIEHTGLSIDRVYTSSDYRNEDCGKYNGGLYPIVLMSEAVQPCDVLHVGDNKLSDIVNAKAAGLAAMYTEPLHESATHQAKGLFLPSNETESATGRTVIGQIVKNWSSPGRVPSPIGDYGYNYGGPLLLGFVSHLISCAKRDGIKRLLLLERDGHIIEKALGVLGIKDVDFRLVPSSRRMAVFPVLSLGGYEQIKSIFAGYENELTEKQFFDILTIELPANHSDTTGKLQTPEDIFDCHKEFLVDAARQERDAIFAELAEEREMLARGEKLAWVDVGWALTSSASLNLLLGHDIPCYCVGSHSHVHDKVSHDGYLFERGAPVDVCDAIISGVELIELIFSDVSQRTVFLEKSEGELRRKTIPKVPSENIRDSYVVEARKGALAFLADINDLASGLELDELRTFNRSIFCTLCSQPSKMQYQCLSHIPHDRLVGDCQWQTIADFWKFPAKQLKLAQEGREYPRKNLKNFLLFRILSVLSRCSPPFSKRRVARFANSAKKRDPRAIRVA
ncbi:MAG: hypothetical protein JKY94_08555 [Rhodobacteraceae bacterium]|nr:hypothetical protein [Paracoccaceae bacterium]